MSERGTQALGEGGGDDATLPRAQPGVAGDPVTLSDLVALAGRQGSGQIRVVEDPTPRQHVVVWLVGVVLASLVPFLFLYFHGLDKSSPPTVFELLGRGDLLLISLVLTIGGITELVLILNKVRQSQIMTVALVLLGALLVVVAEAFWYADLSARLLDGQQVAAAHGVAYGSLLLFLLSALCSSACVHVAAGAR